MREAGCGVRNSLSFSLGGSPKPPGHPDPPAGHCFPGQMARGRQRAGESPAGRTQPARVSASSKVPEPRLPTRRAREPRRSPDGGGSARPSCAWHFGGSNSGAGGAEGWLAAPSHVRWCRESSGLLLSLLWGWAAGRRGAGRLRPLCTSLVPCSGGVLGSDRAPVWSDLHPLPVSALQEAFCRSLSEFSHRTASLGRVLCSPPTSSKLETLFPGGCSPLAAMQSLSPALSRTAPGAAATPLPAE